MTTTESVRAGAGDELSLGRVKAPDPGQAAVTVKWIARNVSVTRGGHQRKKVNISPGMALGVSINAKLVDYSENTYHSRYSVIQYHHSTQNLYMYFAISVVGAKNTNYFGVYNLMPNLEGSRKLRFLIARKMPSWSQVTSYYGTDRQTDGQNGGKN